MKHETCIRNQSVGWGGGGGGVGGGGGGGWGYGGGGGGGVISFDGCRRHCSGFRAYGAQGVGLGGLGWPQGFIMVPQP